MGGIYRKFDQGGVADNRSALEALLDNGLKMVSPDTAEVDEWRVIVNASHRQLAADGAFDPVLLDQVQLLSDQYRVNLVAVVP
jgi:hypothetical protein